MTVDQESSSYHHKDLRPQLLLAAREELAGHGLGDFSLRRIAQASGVSHAAPYRHFQGREGLLAALAWEGQAAFTAFLRKAHDQGPPAPEKRLYRLGLAYLHFAADNGPVFDLMFSRIGLGVMHRHLPEDFKDQPARYDSFGVLEETVREAQAAGVLNTRENSGALAILVWSFVHGFTAISKEGFTASMGEARGYSMEKVEALVLRAFKGLLTDKHRN
jgi:AcrR family transcriptional regulator